MIIDEIRSLLHAQPFQSFSIFTADGQEIVVPHHDYAWVLPTGGKVHVQQFNGKVDIINISQITRVNFQEAVGSENPGTSPRG